MPLAQRNLIGRVTLQTDVWSRVREELETLYGPRCNATHYCADLRGSCLNSTALPISGRDQNGTCQCHVWYSGDDCSQMILDDETCVGFNDRAECLDMRERLFTCGEVSEKDGLPEVCVQEGLTVVECGIAGHMRRASTLGTSGRDMSGLVGRPQAGFAATTCTKCIAHGVDGSLRPETNAKMCDRATVMAACQRGEDMYSQRICNYCGEAIGRSIYQDSESRSACSFFRGTCRGSVEKRLRGIVPPNTDIIGATMFGGLRYCARPDVFSSTSHYYNEDNILLIGQSCIDHTPVWTTWDWSKQIDHPDLVLDDLGTKCRDPDDPVTCPLARNCISGDLCEEDRVDWSSFDSILSEWGEEALAAFADPGSEGLEGGRTFENHKAVLEPQTAYKDAYWPSVTEDYALRYTRVDWSVDQFDADRARNQTNS